MAERLRRRPGDEGFTLVELLVVVSLTALVASATLAVLLSTFRASRLSSDVRQKLDKTRVAVERVRDEVREADEICAESDGDNLRVWVDDDEDGLVDSDETVTFSVAAAGAGYELRRTDDTGTRMLVADLAPQAAWFDYDLAPGAQSAGDLVCQDLATPTGPAGAYARVVELDVAVQTDTPVSGTTDDLAVASSIELRNAGEVVLIGAGGTTDQAPEAGFTFGCVSDTCTFTNTSTDPQGDSLTYSWDFGDGPPAGTSTDEDPTYVFGNASTQTFTVTLTATDPTGNVDSEVKNVTVTIATVANVVHVGDIDDVSTRSGKKWYPAVTIRFHKDDHTSPGATTVHGYFGSQGTGTPYQCTSSSGSCTITRSPCFAVAGESHPSCSGSGGSDLFTVTSVTRGGWTYDQTRNHDPDTDNSDGTTITVVTP